MINRHRLLGLLAVASAGLTSVAVATRPDEPTDSLMEPPEPEKRMFHRLPEPTISKRYFTGDTKKPPALTPRSQRKGWKP